MKARIGILLWLTFVSALSWGQNAGEGVNYAAIYEAIRTGDEAAHDGDLDGARDRYTEALTALQTLSEVRPNWNPSVVRFRINDVRTKLQRLEAPAEDAPEPAPSSSNLDSSEAIRTLDTLHRRVQELESERQDLNQKLDEALSAKPAPAITPEQLESAQEEIVELRKERELLQVQLASERERLAAIESEGGAETQVASLTETVSILKMEKEALQNEVRRLERQTDANGTETQRVIAVGATALGAQLEAATASLTLANTQLEEAQREVARLELDVQDLRGANVQIQEENAALQSTQQTLLAELRGYQARVNDDSAFAEIDQRLAQLSASLEQSRNENEALRRRNASLVEENRRLREIEAQWLRDRDTFEQNLALMGQRLTTGGAGAIQPIAAQRQLTDLQQRAADLESRLEDSLQTNDTLRRQRLVEMALFHRQLDNLKNQVAALNAKPEPLTRRELAQLDDSELQRLERQRMQSQLERAEAVLRNAIEQEPDNLEYRSQLTAVLIERGKMEEAAEQVAAGLRQDPNAVVFLIFDGTIALTQGDNEEAMNALARAVDIEPENPEAQMYLGIALFEMNQIDPAETALRKSVRFAPDSASAHYNLSVVYLFQTPPFRALGKYHYKKARNLGHPANPEIDALLGAL